MKIFFWVKSHLILILIFLISVNSISQNLSEKHERDSIEIVWQKRIDSIASVKRITFYRLLEDMPEDTIGTINMNRLQLNSFPDITRFNNIVAIDASGNKLTRTPKKLLKIDSLVRLNLSDNEICRICFPKNSVIESLNLSENNFRRIPRSIKKLIHLNSLTISDNNIKRIPRFLKKMDNLTSLEINFNKIKLNKADIRRLKNIEVLVMAGNNITKLPDNINELKNVKKINFSKNILNDVPPAFALLDSLEIIIFYQNQFNHIPNEILTITNLRIIDFYYNKISKIPDEFGNLQNLTMIFLAYNNIEVLPDTLKSLQKLRALYIHDNLVHSIPNWITDFSDLEILDISYNKLFSIPDMSEMPALYEVDIQENNIDHFPWKLIEKPNLRLLLLKGNPFILDKEEKKQLEITLKEKRAKGIVIVD